MAREYQCYRCECSTCRRSYYCPECTNCKGSTIKLIGSCLRREEIKVSPEIVGTAFRLVFGVLDVDQFAHILIAAEAVMVEEEGR